VASENRDKRAPGTLAEAGHGAGEGASDRHPCDSESSVFAEAVYVLHAFAKKTQRTPQADIELAARRYREIAKR
jgi:hypothetical protein